MFEEVLIHSSIKMKQRVGHACQLFLHRIFPGQLHFRNHTDALFQKRSYGTRSGRLSSFSPAPLTGRCGQGLDSLPAAGGQTGL